jgi:hypothetical protein
MLVRDHDWLKQEAENENLFERMAWHEAGHAVVGCHLGILIEGIGLSRTLQLDIEYTPVTWWNPHVGQWGKPIPTGSIGKFAGAGRAAEILMVGSPTSVDGVYNKDRDVLRDYRCPKNLSYYAIRAMRILEEGNNKRFLIKLHDIFLEGYKTWEEYPEEEESLKVGKSCRPFYLSMTSLL